jgi:hypothetical protein
VRRGVLAALLVVAFVLQGTISVLAGTTGVINGTVSDPQSGQPVAGATVTATSPSQTASTKSDGSGRFSFISLAPDTYTVTVVPSPDRDSVTISGVTVQADQTQSVTLSPPTKLKVIGTVTSRAASALVKPGTTADVYSINAVTQDKAAALGGGGTLNQAWSAISAVPGVFIQPGQSGYIGAGPSISIRGGDYDQIGYELDGVPVNRSFDNYPSGPVSSLGQQELQVYTGASPANSEAEGLSGYINQVIRTGTAPASRNLDLGLGSPILYNKLSFEAGGANPSRTFSYYLGAGAYNQDYRYYDQSNGAGLQSTYGFPIAPCTTGVGVGCTGPGGVDYTNGGTTPAYVLGGPQLSQLGTVQDRDTVVNLHFGIPQKNGNRDDVQVLADINHISNIYNFSPDAFGGEAYLNAIGFGTPVYLDGYQYTGAPLGALLGPGYTGGGVSNYLYPQSPAGRPLFAPIAPGANDNISNDQGIFKLQYQHNFGTNAFLRVYGYTYYSAWLMADPMSTYSDYVSPGSPDYELSSHTRGVSAEFSDQVSSQHLLTIQGSYTTANALRDNNFQMLNGLGCGLDTEVCGSVAGILVDSTAPYNGKCYAMGGGAAVPCYTATGNDVNPAIGMFTFAQAAGGPGSVPAATGTCGGGPCEYMLAENGLHALYNQVQPKFSSFSVTDQWKPSDKLSLNYGLRFDQFTFDGGNTNEGGARDFWYAAWDAQFPALQQFNVSNQVESYTELEPRIGATYALSPNTVLRASYGRYAEAPNTAFEQYNALQANVPIFLANFVRYGIGDTPGHNIRPEVSNNTDFSIEHQFDRDTSIKFTPFLRKTQDQIQQFYLDQKTNFVSGLNVGRQTAEGIELELDKGDFARNGFAGRLSFTYTNSYINYTPQPNGNSVVYALNQGIANYNSYTSFCSTHAADKRCVVPGATAATVAAPCYTAGGVADPACSAGSIANPYWNAPVQQLINPNGNFPTYDTFPGGVDAGGYETFGAPYVGTLIVQYKHGPWSITPALQFLGGQRYGAPLSEPGIAPDACTGILAGTVAGDPRYPYGAPGGAPYDQTTCGTSGASGVSMAIPDPYTKAFDGVGAFVEPNQILLHTQVAWDINKRITLVANFANIIDRCFGGTKVPFSVSNACTYSNTLGGGIFPPIGNQYNPGNAIQPFLATPYDPYFTQQPFAMYFEARFKL